ncbi:MAG: serine hydrolase domain-containing protein [Bacteroidota bacterium]
MRKYLCFTLFVSICSLSGFAQTRGLEPALGSLTRHQTAAIERARRFMADSLRTYNIPGASVSVSMNGKVVWSEGFGYADLEQKVPVTPETKFRIGSISKPLTAAALGLLYEKGRINLDTLIQAYVPTFPLKRQMITLRQLAGHIAGVRHYRDDEMLLSKRFLTVEAGLGIFRNDTLLFEPGTRFSYSSYAWNLISAAIERATGVEFLQYMDKMVIHPLGMSNTIADFSDSLSQIGQDGTQKIPWVTRLTHRLSTTVTNGQGVGFFQRQKTF